NRRVPIIADHRIKMDFGTGAVKVTPGHDPLDFGLGVTHRLPAITVIGFDGKISWLGQCRREKQWHSRRALEARIKIVNMLAGEGYLKKEEDYIHSVGYCSRSKTIIEPLLSRQWFVKTESMARAAMKAVRSGKIKIVPKRFAKVYFHWLE